MRMTSSSITSVYQHFSHFCRLPGESLAVVVGNAQPDLKAWAATQAAANPRRLCVASKHEAYGILEALERFGLH